MTTELKGTTFVNVQTGNTAGGFNPSRGQKLNSNISLISRRNLRRDRRAVRAI